jgi:hypothetical protein
MARKLGFRAMPANVTRAATSTGSRSDACPWYAACTSMRMVVKLSAPAAGFSHGAGSGPWPGFSGVDS